MSTYKIEEPVQFPWWITCVALINSHICALLRKERKRNEPKWYWKKFAVFQKQSGIITDIFGYHIVRIPKDFFYTRGKKLWLAKFAMGLRRRVDLNKNN